MKKDCSLNQTTFGFWKKGYASLIIKQLISDAKAQGRKGCVLSCKEPLVSHYEQFEREK